MPEDREPNAPDMPHADTRTPLHGPAGGRRRGGVPTVSIVANLGGRRFATAAQRCGAVCSTSVGPPHHGGPAAAQRADSRHSDDGHAASAYFTTARWSRCAAHLSSTRWLPGPGPLFAPQQLGIHCPRGACPLEPLRLLGSAGLRLASETGLVGGEQ
eukprot:scaffold7714_cov133-Isochrysis_galbana.AAC.1